MKFSGLLLCLVLACLLLGCGGGGSSSQSAPAPTPTPTPTVPASYFMVPNRSEAAVPLGGSTSVGFSPIVANGSTDYTVQLSASALPQGVTATFSPNPAPATAFFSLTLSAAANAIPVQNFPISVVATRSVDGAQRQVNFPVDVAPPPGSLPNNRSDFIRTDGFIRDAVFDPVRNLVYVSDWYWNRVQAISLATKTVVKEIQIPRPWGLDLSPDGSRLLVGTETEQLFIVDTGAFQVVEQHRLPALVEDDTFEYTTAVTRQMANGKLLVLSLNSLNGETAIIEWDLTTNIANRPSLGPIFIPFYLLKSADGSHAVIAAGDSSGSVITYSSATDSFSSGFSAGGFLVPLAISPDGSHIAIVDEVNGLLMYDANLNPISRISAGPVGGGLTGGQFSPDGTQLYLELNSDFQPNLVTVNGVTGDFLGVAPATGIIPPFEELEPTFEVGTPLAVDSSGLLFGSLDHGLVIEDTTYFQNLPAVIGGDEFDKLVTPNSGPLNASTAVTIQTSPFDMVPDIWFGSQRGLTVSPANNASNPFGILSAVAPPSSVPGAVNVKIHYPNGNQLFDPLAFSYGPQVMFLDSTAGSPSGGETIPIVALGVPPDPAAVQVKFGNANASVLSASLIAYGPFPTTLLSVRAPAGLPGPADITISTANGSTTVPGAFRYLADISDFPSADRFQSILYDPFRNQVYLAAKSHIDVFSVQSRAFVASFNPPGLNGVPNFGPLALTTDGSRLLAGNMQDPSVAVINPDVPATAVAVPLPPQFGLLCPVVPSSFGVTNLGTALVHLATPPGVNCPVNGLDQLDVNTLQATQVTSLPCNPGDVSASRDGSKVIMSTASFVYCLYDVAGNTWSHPRATGFNGDGRLSDDAGIIWGGARLLDGQGNQLSGLAKPDALFNSTLPLNSDKFEVDTPQLNGSGSLFFSPLSQYVDVFDVRHGTLDFRVALSEHLQPPNDFNPAAFSLHNMDISPLGDRIFLITDAGLTMVQLDAVPLSISRTIPSAGAAGTQVRVQGSGFVAGTSVSLNGSPVLTTFGDASTLTMTVPQIAPGLARMIVKNPDGTSYTLDGAFTIQ